MFVRNGKVAGSVLHSAAPAAKADTPKSAPAKKAAPATAKKPEPAAPVNTKKEASGDGNNDETR